MHRSLPSILSAVLLGLWLSPLSAQAPARDPAVRFDPPDTQYTSADDQEIEAEVKRSLPYASRFRGALPAAVDLTARMPPPGNQGKLRSCTAWAIAYAARSYYTASLDGRDIRQPQNLASPSYVYHLARGPECTGTNFVRITNVLKAGAPSLADYPYADQCTPPPAPQTVANATGFRVRGFNRIDPHQIDNIKGQLAQSNPVLISFADSPAFHRLRGDGVFNDPAFDPDKDGWHSMAIVGYDDSRQAFRLMNSWGQGWGDGGYAWLGYDIVPQRVRDAGVLDVAKSSPETAAPVQPDTPAPPQPGVAQNPSAAGQAGSNTARAFEHLDRGIEYRRKKDHDNAIVEFNVAIGLDPRLARAFNYRGLSWQAKGNPDRALADFNEATRLAPKDPSAYFSRGNLYAAKPDPDRAIADYDQAIRLNPRFAAAYSGRGGAWRKKGDLDRAVADYDQAIRIEPQNADFYNTRGNAFLDKKDYDRAFDDYTEATRINPAFAGPYNNRGLVWVNRKDYDRAVAEYTAALRLNPNYALAYRNRATALRLQNKLDQALADNEEAVRNEPNNADNYFQRAFTLRQKGNQDAAIADLNEALRLNPKHVFAYYNRATIWRTQKEPGRAIDDYTQCLQLDPTFVGALTGRGLAHEAKGELAPARQDFRAALALPEKYDSGKWAHQTAAARLALLEPAGAAVSATATPGPKPAASTPPGPKPPGPAATAPGTSAPPITPPAVGTSNRLALVIGNGAYRSAMELPNPPGDARAIASALRDIGFTVIEGIDLDRVKMEATTIEFLRRASSARVALLYYAGHGVQIDGRNYLVPIDATEIRKESASFELIDVDRILAGLDDEARANVIILDACRDNPLEAHTASRSGVRGGGLAGYSNVGSGMLIAFATAPGKTALDGSGEHSPFTEAMLKHIGTPNIEINEMLTHVRVDVVAATDRRQIPWVNSSLLGDLYLNDRRH